MKFSIRYAVYGAAGAMTLLAPLAAFAHEHHVYQIGNTPYTIGVGFMNEPVAVDDKSGVEVEVTKGNEFAEMGHTDHAAMADTHDAASSKVTGLENTLKVEISAGGVKQVFPLKPKWNDPGNYYAVFYPSAQTAYAFRLLGTIADKPVDVTFACNEKGQAAEDKSMVKISGDVTQIYKTGSFGCPASRMDATFPPSSASLSSLDQKVQGLSTSVSDAGVQASSAGSQAMTGIVLGALGLIAGIGAWVRRPKMGM